MTFYADKKKKKAVHVKNIPHPSLKREQSLNYNPLVDTINVSGVRVLEFGLSLNQLHKVS